MRDHDLADLAFVTPEQALRHPTWSMGRKITVDCATLMNKGFEVIEARWLFDVPWERIEVVVHPESIIHSMMEFDDGSVKAQLGPPDMRLPIQYALFHGEHRANDGLARFDPLKAGALTFKPLDEGRYPCFFLALEAGHRGSTYPAVLSAADEVAVRLFLDRRIGFLDMPVFLINADGTKSVAARQCTAHYKINPIHRELRKILKLEPGRRAPMDMQVEMWMGISADEAQRMKPSRDEWITNRFPLVDMELTRAQLYAWFKERHPDRFLPRSALRILWNRPSTRGL